MEKRALGHIERECEKQGKILVPDIDPYNFFSGKYFAPEDKKNSQSS